ncbi:MAG TPA: ABC transporter ATP-binding protein [Candidatus Methanoperedens sp.]
MSSNPVVLLKQVSFVRNKNLILDDISLCINPGEHWAIIGPNGSGKTSLISIISGYHHPSKGTAGVFGKKFGSTDLRELRRSIGECSSEVRNMIHGLEPAGDIVLSGKFASIGLYESPCPDDLKLADELLEFFGLSDMKHRPFETLSDGEKQKTVIARALMPQPKLLVLDEPCAGLDLKAREELLESIQKISAKPGGPTLVYITHHVEEIFPEITHALALRHGRIVASGTKKEVITGEVLSETFGLSIELQEKGGRLWPMVSGLKCKPLHSF